MTNMKEANMQEQDPKRTSNLKLHIKSHEKTLQIYAYILDLFITISM